MVEEWIQQHHEETRILLVDCTIPRRIFVSSPRPPTFLQVGKVRERAIDGDQIADRYFDDRVQLLTPICEELPLSVVGVNNVQDWLLFLDNDSLRYDERGWRDAEFPRGGSGTTCEQ
jgi:hypothetical protein